VEHPSEFAESEANEGETRRDRDKSPPLSRIRTMEDLITRNDESEASARQNTSRLEIKMSRLNNKEWLRESYPKPRYGSLFTEPTALSALEP
jgi:hypothetical protein